MIEIKGKNKIFMKSLIIFIVVIIFSSTSAYSKEQVDCKNLKRFSLKSAMCKTTSSISAFKNKLSKKREQKKEAKKKSGKKSIFKKFGEAKSLSDLTK